MPNLEFTPRYKWACVLTFCVLGACHNKNNPAPNPKLPGKWKLEYEYNGRIYYDASGVVTSHIKNSRPGQSDEYLEIGDSTWVFLPSTYIYAGANDGIYKLKDTTLVVALNRPSGFNFPITENYTFSELDNHHVVVRKKFMYSYMTYYTKWIYSR
ncbi:hypothetical protein [Hymenobacter actinosclerus]|uniref:hypothetical protein n=1 Tax=Hymenobacter actinosclerus TaxID=82805 RepID=UPI0015A635C3|nr:hypothetical protein [Hymenobacter actinosclerus]